MDSTAWLVAGVVIVMVIGLAGTLLPFVPGLPLIWGAALVYGLVEGFDAMAWVAMIVISLVMIAGMVAKITLPQRRASASGAPRSTLIVGGLLAIVGFFTVPVIGLPLGAVVGILLAEYRRTGDWSPAWSSTKEVLIGFGIGTLLEMGAGLVMIGCWAVWALLQS